MHAFIPKYLAATYLCLALHWVLWQLSNENNTGLGLRELTV